MVKLTYNKPTGAKILDRGNSRYVQKRSPSSRQEQLIVSSTNNYFNDSRPTMVRDKNDVPIHASVNLNNCLPFEEVRLKLEQAVEFTRAENESTIKSLNDQLVNANLEIQKLKYQLAEAPKSSDTVLESVRARDVEIQSLKIDLAKRSVEVDNLIAKYEETVKQLQFKDEEVVKFRIKISELEQLIKFKDEYGNEIEFLKNKLDLLYNKISDGSISPLVGSKMDKPSLEDKIFIDPIDKTREPKLESYIEIEESATTLIDRDVSSDLAKLRSLLK